MQWGGRGQEWKWSGRCRAFQATASKCDNVILLLQLCSFFAAVLLSQVLPTPSRRAPVSAGPSHALGTGAHVCPGLGGCKQLAEPGPGQTGAPCVKVTSTGFIAGPRRGDVEIRHYLRDQAGRSLVFDLIIAHDRFGSSSHVRQNGLFTHPQDLDGPLRVAAQRKINAYGQQYADNQNISFLPAMVSTSNRMHDEFLRLIFLKAHQETEAHFTADAAGMSSQNYQTDVFRFKRAAFLQSLKS